LGWFAGTDTNFFLINQSPSFDYHLILRISTSKTYRGRGKWMRKYSRNWNHWQNRSGFSKVIRIAVSMISIRTTPLEEQWKGILKFLSNA